MEPTPGPFAGVGPHQLPGSLARSLSPAPLGTSLVLTHLAITQGEALEIKKKHPKQGIAQRNKNVRYGAGSASGCWHYTASFDSPDTVPELVFANGA